MRKLNKQSYPSKIITVLKNDHSVTALKITRYKNKYFLSEVYHNYDNFSAFDEVITTAKTESEAKEKAIKSLQEYGYSITAAMEFWDRCRDGDTY